MSYIFLSYAKADREFALTMRDLLREEGFAVWLDENPTEPIAEDWQVVEGYISHAAAFMPILTPKSKASKWLQRELSHAESQEMPIFPFLLEGDSWLNSQHYTMGLGLNLSLPEALLERLHELSPTDKESLPSALPVREPVPERGNPLKFIASVTAIIVILILATFIALPYIESWQTIQETQAVLVLSAEANRAQATETAFSMETEIAATASQNFIHVQATNEIVRTQRMETATQRASTRTANTSAEAATVSANARNAARQNSSAYQTQVARSTQTARSTQIPATRNPYISQTQVAMAATSSANTGSITEGYPCTATATSTQGSVVLLFRIRPSYEFAISRAARDGQLITLVEEIHNEDGLWYRATIDNHSMGYTQAQFIILGEDCPPATGR